MKEEKPVHHASDANARRLIRSICTERQTWFERCEVPTLVAALAIYGGWIALLSFHHRVPWWLLPVAGGYVVQWHSSLQHEAIHSLRGLPKWLRIGLVYPPIGGWFPFELYRRSHLRHHRDGHLTDPLDDPESHYHLPEDWKNYGPLRRGLLIANQTFLGRLFIGAFLHPLRFYWNEGGKIVSGDAANAGIWIRHAIAFAIIMLAVTAIFDMPVSAYFAAFLYPGLVFGMMRSYTEHRWGDRPGERTAVVESNWFFGLLFLWNNLHAVHHIVPAAPWYTLPGIWRQHRDLIIACNGGFVFRGYAEIARRWLVTPNFVPVHPIEAARAGSGLHGDRPVDHAERASAPFMELAACTGSGSFDLLGTQARGSEDEETLRPFSASWAGVPFTNAPSVLPGESGNPGPGSEEIAGVAQYAKGVTAFAQSASSRPE